MVDTNAHILERFDKLLNLRKDQRKQPTDFVVWSRMMKYMERKAKHGKVFWRSQELGTYVRSKKVVTK